jgi:lysophospholipase L1-like esterase
MSGRRKPLFALVAIVLSFGVFEGCSRVALWASPGLHALSQRSFAYKLRDPELKLRGNPDFIDHDEAGWRNAERRMGVDVVAVGDSQTWGSEVSRDDAWPQIAEATSGISFYNIAIGGFGPVQYWRLIDDALALGPKTILIAFYDGNDFYDAFRDVHLRGLAPEIAGSGSQRYVELEAESTLHADWSATRKARKGRAWADFLDVNSWLDENLALYQLVRGLIVTVHGPMAAPVSRVRDDFPSYREIAASAEPGLLVAWEDGDSSTIFTPRGRSAPMDLEDPRVQESLRLTLELVDRIQTLVADQARLAFVLIPTKELVYAERVRARGDALHPSYAELIEREEVLRGRLKEHLDSRGIPWIDSLGSMRASLEAGRPPYGMNWNGHPNPEGDAAIARAVVESPVLSGP